MCKETVSLTLCAVQLLHGSGQQPDLFLMFSLCWFQGVGRSRNNVAETVCTLHCVAFLFPSSCREPSGVSRFCSGGKTTAARSLKRRREPGRAGTLRGWQWRLTDGAQAAEHNRDQGRLFVATNGILHIFLHCNPWLRAKNIVCRQISTFLMRRHTTRG